MSGTIEDIAKKWLAEPAYNKVLFLKFFFFSFFIEDIATRSSFFSNVVSHSDKTSVFTLDFQWKSKHPHFYDV